MHNKEHPPAPARGHRGPAPMMLAVLLAACSLGGCSQLKQLKARVAGHGGTVTVTPAPTPARPAPTAAAPPSSLAGIINGQLQLGHYGEGERQLRNYLQAHPDDDAAKAVLRQLTIDPKQALGRASRSYVARPGDSYSTLAARYLGDPGRFLILARYNGSDNPSLLRVGQTVQLPASAPRLAAASSPETAVQDAPTPPPADASDRPKAQRLQEESLALLHKGQRTQALERMDQALDADPGLPPAGADARALREQLVSVYHQRAIVLYRDQQLDQAIALWNRVLAIEPDFEPATAYRARALELKQRLKQF